MQRNRRRVVIGAAFAASLVALALTIVLALRPPTGPGGPDTLYECTLWFTITELLLLVLYAACILYCERSVDDGSAKTLCITNCLLWWLFLQIALIIGYIFCLIMTFLL